MFLKKSILLTNKQNSSNPIAILQLDNTNTKHIYCTIKVYNLTKNEYILGMLIKDNFLKQNIFFNNNNVYNFKLQNVHIDSIDTISIVMAEKTSDSITPIVWNGTNANKNRIINLLEKDLVISNLQQVNTISANTYKEENNDEKVAQLFEEDESIDKLIDDMVLTENETTNVSETTLDIDTSKTTIDISSSPTFYEQIKDQLDDLFSKYPREESLQKLVPNSEWVKVTYEDSDSHYVVGLIYENNEIKYICFGVPGSMDKEPQDDLKNYSQWLPTDIVNPKDNGYWVMYQDGKNGENIVI